MSRTRLVSRLVLSQCVLSVIAAATLLAGCGGSQPPIGVPDSASLRSASKARGQRTPEIGKALLYVGGGTRLSEYAIGQKRPLRSLVLGYNDICAFALASAGSVFAANCNPSNPVIEVYSKQLLLLRSIIGWWPHSLAVDRSGYLFMAGCWLSIAVVAPGSSSVDYQLRRGVKEACKLSFDSSGRLFAANTRSVSIYRPTDTQGHVRYVGQISIGIKNPTALAFGSLDELFVSNCNRCVYSSGKHRDWVSVYSSKGLRPKYEITDGIDGPQLMAVDTQGTLYVANIPYKRDKPQRGFISVFPAGATSPVREVKEGINTPSALVIDPLGNLNVANNHVGTVTVYSPGGEKLLYTIKAGVGIDPTSMALHV